MLISNLLMFQNFLIVLILNWSKNLISKFNAIRTNILYILYQVFTLNKTLTVKNTLKIEMQSRLKLIK